MQLMRRTLRCRTCAYEELGICSNSWSTKVRFSRHEWIACRTKLRIEESLRSSECWKACWSSWRPSPCIKGVKVEATSWSSSSSSSSSSTSSSSTSAFVWQIGKYRLCEMRDDVDWARVADRWVVSSSNKVLDRSECEAHKTVEALLLTFAEEETFCDVRGEGKRETSLFSLH